MKKERPGLITLLCIFLFILTVGFFTHWGYQWILYLLSKAFNVFTESTFYDLFIGLIAMIASMILFVGTIYLWRMDKTALPYLLWGFSGFLVKNFLDIINDIYPLTKLNVVAFHDVTSVAREISTDLFQMVFWVFLIILFSRKAFQKRFF